MDDNEDDFFRRVGFGHTQSEKTCATCGVIPDIRDYGELTEVENCPRLTAEITKRELDHTHKMPSPIKVCPTLKEYYQNRAVEESHYY